MAKSFSAPAALIATVFAASILPGAIGAGFTFVPAYDSLSCSSVCSAQGLASATLKSSDGPMQTSVCEVNVTGQGRLSGYQEGGSSSCNVVSSSLAGNFSDYSCLCLQLDATPGLATATGSSCSAACDQSIDGLTGSAIATESSEASYTCLPTPEIGHGNRFGFTMDLESGATICTAALDGSAVATPQFSCLCSFEPQASPALQEVAPATTGSLSSSTGSESTDATSTGG